MRCDAHACGTCVSRDVLQEGDNTVLLQQVAGNLLKEFRVQYQKGNKFKGEHHIDML